MLYINKISYANKTKFMIFGWGEFTGEWDGKIIILNHSKIEYYRIKQILIHYNDHLKY